VRGSTLEDDQDDRERGWLSGLVFSSRWFEEEEDEEEDDDDEDELAAALVSFMSVSNSPPIAKILEFQF